MARAIDAGAWLDGLRIRVLGVVRRVIGADMSLYIWHMGVDDVKRYEN